MSLRRPLAPLVLVACLSLAGCLTPKVQPPPSAAILAARAALNAKPATCQPGGLDALSPLLVGFPYDEAQMPEAGTKRLTEAARWLSCNPGTEVVILPSADGRGDAAHMEALATKRAQATLETLRSLGAASAVIHILARNATDPVSTPHLVIQAAGRGW